MRRLAALFALAAALALLPAQAASAETLKLTAGVFPTEQLTALSSSDDPFAVGGGTTAPGGVHFAFSGHCKSATGVCEPGSGTASGYAVVSDPVRGEAQGHVCAMEVVGPPPVPFAGIGVVVEKGSGFLGSLPYLFVLAADFGKEPGSLPDLFAAEPLPECVTSQKEPPLEPVVQGNIVVKP
jgi:hypothetical protein